MGASVLVAPKRMVSRAAMAGVSCSRKSGEMRKHEMHCSLTNREQRRKEPRRKRGLAMWMEMGMRKKQQATTDRKKGALKRRTDVVRKNNRTHGCLARAASAHQQNLFRTERTHGGASHVSECWPNHQISSLLSHLFFFLALILCCSFPFLLLV